MRLKLTLPENPFFVRDTRVFSRRAWQRLLPGLAGRGVMLTLPLLFLERVLPWGPPEPRIREMLALLLLGGAHALFTVAWGAELGFSVFRAEHRRATLESLRLLPQPPWRWLLQKLLFPLFVLAVLWLSALPFYAALALRNMALPHQLAHGLLLVGLFGLLAFLAALRSPPAGEQDESAHARGVLARSSRTGRHLLLVLIGGFLLRALGDWIFWFGGYRDTAWKSYPMFNGSLRGDALLLILLIPYALAAVGTAVETAGCGDRERRPWAGAARALAGMVGWTVFVGALPASASPWSCAFLLALLPGAALALRAAERRPLLSGPREDRLSAPELHWLRRRWDNAVLVRDLRALLRVYSLRRNALFRCMGIAATAAALSALTLLPAGSAFNFVYGNEPSMATFWLRTAANLGLLAPMFAAGFGVTVGATARMRWDQESRLETLGQLLATPLAAEALVRGRWSAAALTAGSMLCSMLLCAACGAVLMSFRRPELLPLYLTLVCLLGSMGLACGAELARPVQAGQYRATPDGLSMRAALFMVTTMGEVLLVGSIAGRLILALSTGSEVPNLAALLGAGAACVLLNGWVAGRCYHGAVAEVGRLRTADMG